MKTYLFQHALIVVSLKKDHLKRLVACALTVGTSLPLIANTAPTYISVSDTNHVISAGADQSAIKLPVNPNSQIAGAVGNEEFSLPLVMTAFKVVVNGNKVVLSWTTGLEKRLSHFVIERSTDGINYKETAIIFAVTNSSAKQNYSYNDNVNIHGKGMLYYRIKLVDPVGKFQNSAVKLIRLGDEISETEVATYPNPVVNELRITIPTAWQNRPVSYEVYNTSGRLVKRITTNSANQTEVLSLVNCNTGLYVVKTSTDRESKSHTIFKK